MGLIHLDAGVIIGFLDSNDAHHKAATEVLSTASMSNDRLSIAASAFAEILVGPARTSPAAVDTVRTVIDRLPISVVALYAEIATEAATLRAQHRSLKLPDALVIATAASSNADVLVTTDRKWPTAKQMKLTISIEQI